LGAISERRRIKKQMHSIHADVDSAFESMNVKSAAVIVAHPDDETLWTGGTILMHPDINWTIITLCRKSDPDRAPRFFKAMERLNAIGTMGDLDDGPEQIPLSQQEIKETLLSLLPQGALFDLILTHSPCGEYTRHRRHEEIGSAAQSLWLNDRLKTQSLWLFAYEDGHRSYLPKAMKTAHLHNLLSQDILKEKYRIITDIYGFAPQSYEAQTTPREEAFFCFSTKQDLTQWLDQGGNKL
jgi:LmbE family N-acetylglucosaminyl deacetylase